MWKHIHESPKDTSLCEKTSYDVYIVKINPPVRPARVVRRSKNIKKFHSGKLDIRLGHSRRRIEISLHCDSFGDAKYYVSSSG